MAASLLGEKRSDFLGPARGGMHDVIEITSLETYPGEIVEAAQVRTLVACPLGSDVDHAECNCKFSEVIRIRNYKYLTILPLYERRVGYLGDEDHLLIPLAMKLNQLAQVWLVDALDKRFDSLLVDICLHKGRIGRWRDCSVRHRTWACRSKPQFLDCLQDC